MRVFLQTICDIRSTLFGYVGAGLQHHPLSIRREQARLYAIGKSLNTVHGSAVKNGRSLFTPADLAVIVSVIEVSLRQRVLIALLIQVAESFLARPRGIIALGQITD